MKQRKQKFDIIKNTERHNHTNGRGSSPCKLSRVEVPPLPAVQVQAFWLVKMWKPWDQLAASPTSAHLHIETVLLPNTSHKSAAFSNCGLRLLPFLQPRPPTLSWWCCWITARPCSSRTARRPPLLSPSASCGSPSSRCAPRRRPTASTSLCRSPTGGLQRSGTAAPGGGACWRPAGFCWGSGTCSPRCRQSGHERTAS